MAYNNNGGIFSKRHGLNLMSLHGNNDWNSTSLYNRHTIIYIIILN